MKTISLKIPEKLEARLKVVAGKQGRAKSEIVRAALEAYFDSEGEIGDASFLAMASDLSGVVSGPEDLSSNPEYMDGYGE